MRKYHKHHKEALFNAPSLVYDIDLFKEGLSTGSSAEKGFRPQEFDAAVHIKDAYNKVIDMTKRHFRSLGGVTSGV